MTGYTRTSTADIAPDEVVRAAPLNSEYNAIEAAFAGGSGHAHDGSVGSGPKINLSTSVVNVLPIGNGGTGATTAATARTALGVAIGSAVQAWNAILDSISVLATNGFIARVSAGVIAARTMTGTTAEITVTNGDGIAGNPTFSLPAAMTMTGKTLSNGTYSGGTFSGTWSGPLATAAATITGGTITGITDIAVADGGTGASTAANARTNLGLGTIATQDANSVNLTGGTITGISVSGTINTSSAVITGGSITGITDLAIADGGTGASTAAAARTNLGLLAIASTGDAADLTGTVASARITGTYGNLTGTGALTAGSINWTGQIVTSVGIQAGTTLSAGSTITAGSNITANGTVTASQNFSSATAAAVLGAQSGGTVYLRPNGVGSASGETTVNSVGTLTSTYIFGTTGVQSGSAVYQTNGDINGSVWTSWGSASSFTAIAAQIESRGNAWANYAINNILPTIAAQGAGAVGTYAFCRYNGGSAAANTITNGTNLSYSDDTGFTGNNVGGGSWRMFGHTSAASKATLWLRYA